jgi:hypothetical protein
MKLILSFFLLFIIKSLNAKAYSKVNRELGIKYNGSNKHIAITSYKLLFVS